MEGSRRTWISRKKEKKESVSYFQQLLFKDVQCNLGSTNSSVGTGGSFKSVLRDDSKDA